VGWLGDLRDPALLDDPYPTYRRLLEHAPVSWDDQHGMWLVLGHAEVLEAFRRPETSVATAAARIRPALGAGAARFERLISAISHFLTRVDAPEHTRLRALVQKAFTLQSVERMQAMVSSLVDGYLEALPSTGTAGLVRRFPGLGLDRNAAPRRAPNFSLRGFASLPVTY
jgi:cytochrome P450